MEFRYKDKVFQIDFERQYREGVKTRYPYTTATVNEIIGPQRTRVVRTYSVGCHHTDRFSFEEGRKAALKMALFDDPRAPKNSMALDKEFKRVCWDSYFKRWKDGLKRVNRWGRVIH